MVRAVARVFLSVRPARCSPSGDVSSNKKLPVKISLLRSYRRLSKWEAGISELWTIRQLLSNVPSGTFEGRQGETVATERAGQTQSWSYPGNGVGLVGRNLARREHIRLPPSAPFKP